MASVKFFNEIGEIPSSDSLTLTFVLKRGICSKTELLDELSHGLHLPGYFGMNWDALNEVLFDINWLDVYYVNLVHLDLPKLTLDDLKTYIGILNSSVDCCDSSRNYDFNVYFDYSIQEIISKLAS
jgi:RNAse (barnase) inhibitor barstar